MKPGFRLSTWIIPLPYALVAALCSIGIPRLELRLFPGLAAPATATAAVAIYSSIASGMLALTGVVFSLAFVMIQFSAAAYSPRLVLWVSRDPFLWHAVGVFTATFLYAIGALAWVGRNSSAQVPFVSGWITMGLLLASVLMFVGLIQRIGLLQVHRMLSFTGNQGRKVIETTYPRLDSPASSVGSEECHRLPLSQVLIYRGRPRAIQALDTDKLARVATEAGGVIQMVAAVGDTVCDMTPLMRVFGARQTVDERALTRAVRCGEDRTFNQDPKYAIRLLVDIGIKALSPAINDPTTAVQALDQIEDLLLRLGLRHLEIGDFHDNQGQLRLVVLYPTWEDFLRLAFDEICYCGARSVQVMRRMKALVQDLIARLPEQRHSALHYWDKRLQNTITRSFDEIEERLEASVEDRQGLGVPRKPRAVA